LSEVGKSREGEAGALETRAKDNLTGPRAYEKRKAGGDKSYQRETKTDGSGELFRATRQKNQRGENCLGKEENC